MGGWLRAYWAGVFDFRARTPEGFPLTGHAFIVPEDALSLDRQGKRTVAICNLFANQQKPIKEIVRLLDATLPQVIAALLENRLIADRRCAQRNVTVERRRDLKCHLPLFWLTGKPDHQLQSLCGGIGGEIVSEFVFLEVIRDCERCEECWLRRDKERADS
ncbi:MAG: hypothetical protein AB1898_09180 [Acidobacteriota bacterium]